MSSEFLNNTQSPPPATILSVNNLKVHFPIGKRMLSSQPKALLKAVDGVSFTLGAGEPLGLVGESG